MKIEDLDGLEPTATENNSKIYLFHICYESGWRIYPPESVESAGLIQRFLRSHAQVYSILGDQVIANRPMVVAEVNTTGNPPIKVKVAGFLNGAILRTRVGTRSYRDILFVDEPTALRWGYPKTGFTVASTKENNG